MIKHRARSPSERQRKIFAVTLSLLLTGCDAEEGNKRPWAGYAWNKEHKAHEYFWSDWETERDCRVSMHAKVALGGDSSEWYSEPTGCTYHGNSYWRVVLMNALFGGEQAGCVRRNTDGYAEKLFVTYSPQSKEPRPHRLPIPTACDPAFEIPAQYAPQGSATLESMLQ
jgi:hypothetical protein